MNTIAISMTDNYSGRSINFRVEISKWESSKENGKYDWMTDSQRTKAENFFGKELAYHTELEEL